jgi:MFS family permease
VTFLASRTRSYQPQRPSSTGDTGISKRQWLALGVMSFTVLLISLDQTVLNVALPTLVKELHPSSSGLQWIADSYTLTNAVLLLFGGALGDRFGRRRLFLIGTAIFGGGSLACALVHSTGPLIGARAVMGLGAAFLMPATLSIIASMFSGHRRARAIGIWVGVGGIGTAAGPLLGGWLLQHFWWGSVFLINVPIAVLALVGGFFAVAESRAINRPGLDPVGVVLSSLGLTALTYGLIVTSTDGWGSTTVVSSLSLAVVLLVVFFVWDRGRSMPFLDLQLFANRSLLGSNTAARLTRRFGLRTMMLFGMMLVTGGLVSLAELTVASGFLTVGLGSGLIGLGMGLVIAPASNAIVGTLAPDKVGAGSGLRSMVQLLGGSFGVAIVGSLATRTYRSEMQSAFAGPLRRVPAGLRKVIGNQLGDAQGAAARLPRGLGRATTHAADHAFVSGLHLAALVGIGMMVIALLSAAIYVPARVAIVHDDDDVNVGGHM